MTTKEMNMNVANAIPMPLEIVKEVEPILKGRDLPCMNIDEICEMDFPEPEYLVDGLIPKVGLGVIAGNPKAGKSFFALQLACCVATGKPFLGREVQQGSVLYLALEDSRGRISWRTKATKELLEVEKIGDLKVHCQDDDWLGTFKNGGLDAIQKWIDEKDNPKLVLIDTYQVFSGIQAGGSDAYQKDVEFIAPIQMQVLKSGVTIIFIHHLNKAGGFMGSQGILGSSDWNMKLLGNDEENLNNRNLSGEGRDLPPFSETLERKKVTPDDKRGYVFESCGDTNTYRGTKESEEVFKAGRLIEMEKHKDGQPIAWTVDELKEMLPMKRDTLKHRLERMVKRKELDSPNKKYYWINLLKFEIGYERSEALTRCPNDR